MVLGPKSVRFWYQFQLLFGSCAYAMDISWFYLLGEISFQINQGAPMIIPKNMMIGHELNCLLFLETTFCETRLPIASFQASSAFPGGRNLRISSTLRTKYLNVLMMARADTIWHIWDLSLERLSATPTTARNELYKAWNVESNIMLTEVKACTILSIDWKACRELSSTWW